MQFRGSGTGSISMERLDMSVERIKSKPPVEAQKEKIWSSTGGFGFIFLDVKLFNSISSGAKRSFKRIKRKELNRTVCWIIHKKQLLLNIIH